MDGFNFTNYYVDEVTKAVQKVVEYCEIDPKEMTLQDFRQYISSLEKRNILPYYSAVILNSPNKILLSALTTVISQNINTKQLNVQDTEYCLNSINHFLTMEDYEKLYNLMFLKMPEIKSDIERLSSGSVIPQSQITKALFFTRRPKSDNAIITALYFLCNIESKSAVQSAVFNRWKFNGILPFYEEETGKTIFITNPLLGKNRDNNIYIENSGFESYRSFWRIIISNSKFIKFFDSIANTKDSNKEPIRNSDPFYSELELAIDKIANYDKEVDISKMDISIFKKYVMNVDYVGEGKIPTSVCPTILSTPDKTLQAAIISYLVKENENHYNTQEIRKIEEEPYKNSWRQDIKEDLNFIRSYLTNHQSESSKIDRINSFFIPEYENLLKYYAEAERSNNTTIVSALKNEINSFEKVFKSYLTQTIKALFIEEQTQAKVSTKVAEQLLQMDFGDYEAEDRELE